MDSVHRRILGLNIQEIAGDARSAVNRRTLTCYDGGEKEIGQRHISLGRETKKELKGRKIGSFKEFSGITPSQAERGCSSRDKEKEM